MRWSHARISWLPADRIGGLAGLPAGDEAPRRLEVRERGRDRAVEDGVEEAAVGGGTQRGARDLAVDAVDDGGELDEHAADDQREQPGAPERERGGGGEGEEEARDRDGCRRDAEADEEERKRA